MRSVKRALAIVALAATVTTGLAMQPGTTGFQAAQAQEFSESHLAASRRAIVATRSSNRLDNILPEMAQEIKAELIRNRPDKEAELSLIVDEAAISLAGRRGDLEREVVQVFARVFTEDELTQIADFYESEAGKKFLTETPVVLREIDRASQVWANGLQRDLQASVVEKLDAAGLR